MVDYRTLALIRTIAIVLAIAIFCITVVFLFVRIVCARKTSWTFYDGAIIYKKGRILFTEEMTRDMEFFPGMEISVRCTVKGKIFKYGKVIISNGAGEAGEIVMHGVKHPHKVQAVLREMLAVCCTRTANMMSPYKMYPQMYRHVLGGYPAYYYGAMQMNQMNPGNGK